MEIYRPLGLKHYEQDWQILCVRLATCGLTVYITTIR